jgi:hypothetical protein
MRPLQVALLAAPLTLIATPPIATVAQPLCYMIKPNGQMVDLTKMCNTSKAIAPIPQPLPASNRNSTERDCLTYGNQAYCLIGEINSGKVALDMGSIRTGADNFFDLAVFKNSPLNGTRFQYQFDCNKGRGTSALVQTWVVVDGARVGGKVDPSIQIPQRGSILDKTLNIVCEGKGYF